MRLRLLGAIGVSVFTFGIFTSASAALVDNGGGLIYDTVLDITWGQPDAERRWDNANTWAAGLTLGGVSGWRLPYISAAAGAGPFSAPPVDCGTASELDCRDNELGYMFYQNLGGTYGQSILDSGDPNLALFPMLQSDWYWAGTEMAFPPNTAWNFYFRLGEASYNSQDDRDYSWAVHSGNVSAVSVPAAVWLFASGLIGLVGVARRKAA